jgi:hypothetical protein
MLLDFEKFVEHKSTFERGFQKREKRFLPGIEPASSVVGTRFLNSNGLGFGDFWSRIDHFKIAKDF